MASKLKITVANAEQAENIASSFDHAVGDKFMSKVEIVFHVTSKRHINRALKWFAVDEQDGVLDFAFDCQVEDAK